MSQNHPLFTTIPLRVLKWSDSRKAILFDRGKGKGDAFWIPISQIFEPDPETLSEGDEQELRIPRWLAEEKGLDEDAPATA